jgi:hypothetical protein
MQRGIICELTRAAEACQVRMSSAAAQPLCLCTNPEEPRQQHDQQHGCVPAAQSQEQARSWTSLQARKVRRLGSICTWARQQSCHGRPPAFLLLMSMLWYCTDSALGHHKFFRYYLHKGAENHRWYIIKDCHGIAAILSSSQQSCSGASSQCSAAMSIHLDFLFLCTDKARGAHRSSMRRHLSQPEASEASPRRWPGTADVWSSARCQVGLLFLASRFG